MGIVSLQNAKQLLQRLKLLSVVDLIGDTASIDKAAQLRLTQRKRMQPVINLWKQLQTKATTTSKVMKSHKNNKNPVSNAIALEIEKADAMIGHINKCMVQMEKELFGNGALNNAL